MDSELIIGVTGPWKDRTSLVQDVAAKSGGYLLAGNILHNASANVGYEIDVYDHEPTLKEAYYYAGQGRFDEEFLEEVGRHTYTVYLFAKSGGDFLPSLVAAVGGLLKAGGTGVKVETSGIAFTGEEWNELLHSTDPFLLYSHFVALIGDESSYYSVGMKSFELPDIVVPNQLDATNAADIMNQFNYYCITEQPTFAEGHTFSLSADSDVYTLSFRADTRYGEEHPFSNPYGLVFLIKA